MEKTETTEYKIYESKGSGFEAGEVLIRKNIAPDIIPNQMFWKQGKLLRVPFTNLEIWLVRVWPS